MIDVTSFNPFLADRDPKESLASQVFRESVLEAKPPARCFRQDGSDEGYALTFGDPPAERILTIPEAKQADFTFHGNEGSTAAGLAEFIAETVGKAEAHALKLPLLSRLQGTVLREQLAEMLPGWRLGVGLTAVRPTVDKGRDGWRRRNTLLRDFESAPTRGLDVRTVSALPRAEVIRLHTGRWGPNRSPAFFGMLDDLASAGVGTLRIARNPDGTLVGVQVDIVGSHTRHLYYGLADTEHCSGIGTIMTGASWSDFMDSELETSFSFGRGSERYKFQYANHVVELYELRGFLAHG